MQKIRRLIITLLISYAVVLIVNIAGNYQYYAAGNDWTFSVSFSLIVTTIGWLGYTILHQLIFRHILDWKHRPNLSLLMAVVISGIYGVLLMVFVMKGMVWFLGYKEQPQYDYINNSIYAALFSMLIGLAITGSEFLRQLKKSAEDNERMKAEMVRSQYEVLKSQVNPHFLFNSLNTLAAIIPGKPDVAVNFVQQLAKVFRYSLQYGESNTVPIEIELKIVRSYLFLNTQRFEGKLEANITISDASIEKHIVTQSLLMLVENVIKHNEISKENPLTLTITEERDYLVVCNNLQRRQIHEPSTRIGLQNIRNRYALVTDVPVVFTEDANTFTVKIPMLSNEHPATGR
ncbi:MAG: sensor histidine kinase [Flavipsychrobacter sp.]